VETFLKGKREFESHVQQLRELVAVNRDVFSYTDLKSLKYLEVDCSSINKSLTNQVENLR